MSQQFNATKNNYSCFSPISGSSYSSQITLDLAPTLPAVLDYVLNLPGYLKTQY